MTLQLATTRHIAARAKPRTDQGPAFVVSPVDFSFCELKSIAEALDEDPRPSPRIYGVKGAERKKGGKSPSKTVKFNNNMLLNLTGLNAFVDTFLENKMSLYWLDLSFNEIKTVDQELLGFPNLAILYLQSNKIADFSEVEKLAGLTALRKLTLYGNPVAVRGYRNAVIARFPQLQELDFTQIGKGDKATADTLRRLVEGTKKKGNKEQEEED